MSEERYQAGLSARKSVLGEAYVDRALSNVDSFNREFQQLVTEYCWGTIWGYDRLSRKQRSLNNLCMLAALNRPHEFKIHVRGALTNGVSLNEIKETLMQIAVYCGVPAGVEAFKLAREVLDEEGVEVPKE